MRILIYGAGVIGSIFAGKLACAKNVTVTVLARGKRFEELKNAGITLANPRTMRVEQAAVNVIDTHVALVTSIANALYEFDCDNFKFGRSFNAVKLMIRGIQEGRQVLRENGITPTPWKLFWLDLPQPVLAGFFSVFMRTTLAETTMAKHCVAAKSEMMFLQQEFDELIIKSGIDTPAIDELKRNL